MKLFFIMSFLFVSNLLHANESAFPFCKLTWEALPDYTPGFILKAKPQGLVWHEGFLYFSNHFNDTKSLIYKINPETHEVESYFTLPNEFVHVSGLTAYGNNLIALDYKTNTLITLDIQESFEQRMPKILKKQKAPFKGASGLGSVIQNDVIMLAISDFLIPYLPRKTGRMRTHVFPTSLDEETFNLDKETSINYKSGRYSQGLTFIEFGGKTYLVESLNTVIREWRLMDKAIDLIRIHDFEKLKNNEESLVAEFDAPAGMVEDLAWDPENEVLWTSDEGTYKFYQGKFVSCTSL